MLTHQVHCSEIRTTAAAVSRSFGQILMQLGPRQHGWMAGVPAPCSRDTAAAANTR